MSLRKLREVKMTVNGHEEGSKESHNKVRKYVNSIGIKMRMDQDIFEKEIDEIKENLSKLLELLQGSEEDRCSGWTLSKRKLQWYALQHKQRQRSYTCLKSRELRETELRSELMIKEGVHTCEHEQGNFLSESSDASRRPMEVS